MMENYLVKDFRRTAAQRFPAQAEQLNATFDARLRTLWEENAGASREKKEHLRRQILPGVAAYETLQTVMPKDEALRTVHGYVEQLAVRAHRSLAAALRVPGLYRLVPGIFVRSTRTAFGPAAGFAATELRTDSTTLRGESIFLRAKRAKMRGSERSPFSNESTRRNIRRVLSFVLREKITQGRLVSLYVLMLPSIDKGRPAFRRP